MTSTSSQGMLILQDGEVIIADSFGANCDKFGEIVFNTSMTGYQEIITDPSYAGQIIVMTYPEIGNYGLNDFDFEAKNPALVGFVVKNYCKDSFESHYQSSMSIEKYLKEHNIPALSNIDTRSLVMKIREFGTMSAYISSKILSESEIKQKVEELQTFKVKSNIIDYVTCNQKYEFNKEGEIDLAYIDYGTKEGIINSLAQRGCKITVYPSSTTAKEIIDGNHDVLFLSNGPGNPADYTFQIEQIKLLEGKIPIFGICLGYQLLALSLGAETYKLKYGHRGGNHPVINLENNKVMITSQNHGYAVDTNKITKIMRPTYKNLNDDTLEGFESEALKIYAVQFHPESKPGPIDAAIIFDEWVNLMKRHINKKQKELNEV